MNKIKIILLCFFLSTELFSQIGTIIPQDRTVDWKTAGLETPPQESTNRFVSVKDYGAIGNGVFDDTQPIKKAIADASNNNSGVSLVYFPAGNYYVTDQIVLGSNVVLKGAGADKTQISFLLNHDKPAFLIQGSSESNFKSVISGNSNGSMMLGLNEPAGTISKGDYIELIMDNGTWRQNVYDGGFNPQSYVGQIIKIESVDNSLLYLKDKLSITYNFNPRIRKIFPVMNTGIEDMKINRLSNGKGAGSNFIFYYAANCWLKGVESNNTCRYHAEISASTAIEIKGCFFHHAEDYGDGGYGYGIAINFHSTNCLVENNIFQRLRHAMLLQLGANKNVFGFNYSREQHSTYIEPIGNYQITTTLGDVCVHGHYPYANLYEGNVVEAISVDDYWGDNGPFNTFFRNKVTRNDNLIQMGGIHIQASNQNIIGNVLEDISDQFYNSGNFENYNGVAGSSGDAPCNDISYYKTAMPDFLAGYSWPPVGTRTNVSTLAQTIPAVTRWNSGGIRTVPGKDISLWQVTAEAPTLYLPAQNQKDAALNVQCIWQKIMGAKKYLFELAYDVNFQLKIITDSLLTDTVKALTSLNGSTKYYWRVKALNDYGSGSYSAVFNFTTVQQTGLLLTGFVNYYNRQNWPLANVFIYLTSQNGEVRNTISDSTGKFNFTGIAPGTYILTAVKNDDWGGANSADALMVAQNYVNLTLLDAIQKCSADVNNSGTVNSSDALFIQQRFINSISRYPNGKADWIFRVLDDNSSDSGVLTGACQNDTVIINNSDKTIYVKGLCSGDVNKSYQK